jgi:magnesium transporter
MTHVRSEERLQRSLADITRLLGKHRILATLAHRQEGPRRDLLESLQHRQNLVELHKQLRGMHAADIAYVLEALPHDDRRTVWEQLSPEQAGQVLVEVSDAVRESLLAVTGHDDLVKLLLTLDPDDLAYVAESLSPDLRAAVSRGLALTERTAFDEAVHYPDTSVGRYMSREFVTVPETHTIHQALADLRGRGDLPPQTDRIFVVDSRHVLRGALPLPTLLLTDPAAPVAAVIAEEAMAFGPQDDAADAAQAFERYDLVSAPVVDERGKLVGRLTVDAVMDFVRDEANLQALKRAGLTGDEDLFAGPWQSARNRWPWLGINLVTAFAASRVIGSFEGEIQRLASLAALMPIVASIGGNTGNQTMALVIRGLALDRVKPASARRMVNKELLISLLNGGVWGIVVGVFALLLYANLALGAVMACAVVMNLVVAALAGVAVPLGLHAAGRDPAHGSSVLLTFITDAMGFFLFLGLASVFLL